jgi:hypothetical protein
VNISEIVMLLLCILNIVLITTFEPNCVNAIGGWIVAIFYIISED